MKCTPIDKKRTISYLDANVVTDNSFMVAYLQATNPNRKKHLPARKAMPVSPQRERNCTASVYVFETGTAQETSGVEEENEEARLLMKRSATNTGAKS